MFTASALRNMDPALEEAAEVSGATRAAHAAHRHVPADRAGDHVGHAAVVHRHARHLRHPGGARHARRHPRAHDLHLQAHQLVAAALQHGSVRRDHPDGGHGLPRVAAAARVLSRRSYTTVAGKSFRPALLNLGPWRYFTLGLAVVYLFVVVVLPTLGADRRGVPQVPVHAHASPACSTSANTASSISSGCSPTRWRCARSSTPWRSG